MRRHLTRVFDVSSASQKNSEHRGTARANFGIEQWRISPAPLRRMRLQHFASLWQLSCTGELGLLSKLSALYDLLPRSGDCCPRWGSRCWHICRHIGRHNCMVGVYAPAYLTFGQAVSLLIYLFASLFIVWAANHYRELRSDLKTKRNFARWQLKSLHTD